jgi:hypothetical protein
MVFVYCLHKLLKIWYLGIGLARQHVVVCFVLEGALARPCSLLERVRNPLIAYCGRGEFVCCGTTVIMVRVCHICVGLEYVIPGYKMVCVWLKLCSTVA